MATVGQFYWPSVGTFVAAYGQFFMAANTLTPTFICLLQSSAIFAFKRIFRALRGKVGLKCHADSEKPHGKGPTVPAGFVIHTRHRNNRWCGLRFCFPISGREFFLRSGKPDLNALASTFEAAGPPHQTRIYP